MRRPDLTDRLRAVVARGALRLPAPDPELRTAGQDSTGLVRVRVDGGGRVVDVEVDRSWHASLRPHALAAALCEAFSAAATARLQGWARTVPVRAAAPCDDTRTPAVLGSPRDLRARVDLLVRAAADLAEFRLQLAERWARESIGRSRDGAVVAVVRNGALDRMELDERWLGSATPAEIAVRSADAIRAAFDAAERIPDDAIGGCPDLSHLLALTSGPVR